MGIILNILCSFLFNSILKMCIDATVRDELLIFRSVGNESIISETAIVTVVLLNADRVLCYKFLTCPPGFNGFSKRKSLVEINIAKVGEVIKKYGSCLGLLSHQASFKFVMNPSQED